MSEDKQPEEVEDRPETRTEEPTEPSPASPSEAPSGPPPGLIEAAGRATLIAQAKYLLGEIEGSAFSARVKVRLQEAVVAALLEEV